MAPSKLPRAVISGDLILSERLSAAVRRNVPRKLSECADNLREISGIAVSDIDVFRGDAWQMIVNTPADALRVCLSIRTELRAWQSQVDTRTVIGIGMIESEGDGRVSSGYGEAFTLSGRGLDEIPRDRRMALHMSGQPEAMPSILDAGVHLLDRIVMGWTAAQARAVLGAMRGHSQDEIGADWKDGAISQQAVAQHLRRASWNAVNHWLTAYADFITHHIRP